MNEKMKQTLGSMALLLFLATTGYASTNTLAPTVMIRIKGGHGHLTSMDLKTDGAFHWHGWEPGRRVVSLHDGKLDEKELKEVTKLASQVAAAKGKTSFTGGRKTYTLILSGFTGKDVKIAISHGTEDNRPAKLKALLDVLWATRSRKKK